MASDVTQSSEDVQYVLSLLAFPLTGRDPPHMLDSPPVAYEGTCYHRLQLSYTVLDNFPLPGYGACTAYILQSV